MGLRRFLRGQVEWVRLEGVAREVARRYDQDVVRVEFLEADNWLSTPCVVNDRWFVKLISPQNSLMHTVFTTGRNLGAFSSGREGFFEHFDTPIEMAEHELEATARIRELGLNAPRPVEAFEYGGLGVVVLEYLDDFRTLDQLGGEEATSLAPELFLALATMHDAGLAHGDLREENVLVSDGELYFIDATNVREDAIGDARAYDLACALGALAPHIGAHETVGAARTAYATEELLAAEEFLDFVNLRPDHDFEAATIRGAIEQAAT